jgi:hypothetical protein
MIGGRRSYRVARKITSIWGVKSALPVAYSMLEMRNYHRSDVSRVECRHMTVTSIVGFLLSPVSRSVAASILLHCLAECIMAHESEVLRDSANLCVLHICHNNKDIVAAMVVLAP